MTLKDFIKEHKSELDNCIKKCLGNPDLRLNYEERRLWILNDEGLYQWARSCGVRL